MAKLTMVFPAVLVAIGVVYGSVSYNWANTAYLMSLAPYGLLLGAIWPRSLYPLVCSIIASTGAALSFPIANAFC